VPKRRRDRESSGGLAPLGRHRLDFGLLHEDEFELLCFYAIAVDFPEVVHLASPDGGADAALPHDNRSWARCWQSKRYTQQVKWPQCVASLDAGVKNFAVPHYTFCFARDLTYPQEKLFKKHLVGRHPGVVVDYWGATRLEGLLFSSEQGKRIAAEFWGHREADTRAMARALRAGGSLSTGAKVLDRLAAIAEHLRERDPFYTYITVTAEVGSPRPGPTPRAVLAVETVDAGSIMRVEAVPRPATLPEQLPEGTVHMTVEQAEQFERFLARGGDLRLEGVQVDFRNLPSALEELDTSGQEMTVLMRAPRRLPPPWDARFCLNVPGFDLEPITLHLEPTLDVPSDWEAAMVGKSGALSTELLLRRRDDRGQVMVRWSFKDDLAVPTRVRAAQLNFVGGLHRRGTLVIEDAAGIRPRLEFETVDRELDDEFEALRTFTGDLATIEEWTGDEYIATELVPATEVRAIHDMARIIRTGGSSMNFGRVLLTMPRERADELLKDGDHQFLFEIGVGLAVMGTEIPIGLLRGVVRDVAISYAESEESGMVDVTLEPATEEAARPSFQLVRPGAPRALGSADDSQRRGPG
jgi:hypothetical protein